MCAWVCVFESVKCDIIMSIHAMIPTHPQQTLAGTRDPPASQRGHCGPAAGPAAHEARLSRSQAASGHRRGIFDQKRATRWRSGYVYVCCVRCSMTLGSTDLYTMSTRTPTVSLLEDVILLNACKVFLLIVHKEHSCNVGPLSTSQVRQE